jgi:hypothetical protein
MKKMKFFKKMDIFLGSYGVNLKQNLGRCQYLLLFTRPFCKIHNETHFATIILLQAYMSK